MTTTMRSVWAWDVQTKSYAERVAYENVLTCAAMFAGTASAAGNIDSSRSLPWRMGS